MSDTPTPTPLDLSKLTAKELKAMLAEKQKAEKAEQEQAQRDYERDRDRFIRATAVEFVELAAKLKSLKQRVIARGNELHERMYLIKDQEPKPLKSFSLISDDGTLKLEVERAERMALNETSEVAIETIKKVLAEKFEARNKSMYNIITTLLNKNNKGDYDERLVAKLSKHEADIDDERFTSALADLRQAFYAIDSATYCRLYQLNTDTGAWDAVNIQFSSI